MFVWGEPDDDFYECGDWEVSVKYCKLVKTKSLLYGYSLSDITMAVL